MQRTTVVKGEHMIYSPHMVGLSVPDWNRIQIYLSITRSYIYVPKRSSLLWCRENPLLVKIIFQMFYFNNSLFLKHRITPDYLGGRDLRYIYLTVQRKPSQSFWLPNLYDFFKIIEFEYLVRFWHLQKLLKDRSWCQYFISAVQCLTVCEDVVMQKWLWRLAQNQAMETTDAFWLILWL